MELASTKAKLREIESKFSSQERELLAAKADCTLSYSLAFLNNLIDMLTVDAINRDEITALETLKETNEIVTTSLQNDLLVLQTEHKNITTDFEQQKTHLLETLLAKEQLTKDLADAKEGKVVGNDQLDETEKADLKKSTEVSRNIKPTLKQRSSARQKSVKRLHQFHPFHPYTPNPEPSPVLLQTDIDTLLAVEIAGERAAIGRGPPLVLPILSPRTIPLPMSPAPVQEPPNLVNRFESGHSIAQTDTITANPEARTGYSRPPKKTQDRRRKQPWCAKGTVSKISFPVNKYETHLHPYFESTLFSSRGLSLYILWSASQSTTDDFVKAAHESMIKNLTRENALIASAWYDLSSRLQSNHVVLQRRQDAPKSWLNKQRQMVNSTPRRW